MLSQFERQPNIAVLNLERDLKDALPEVMYQENYSADLNLMDYLRRSNQARTMCSLCCATPPRSGYRTRAGSQGHVLRSIPLKDFRFNMCAFARQRTTRALSDRVLAKAKEHSAMFSSNSRKQDATVRVRALGEAHATVKELVRDIQAVQPKAYRYTVQICTVRTVCFTCT
ncbi:hypothetical protein Q5P01_000905 [Channa striata]|uniref:Uncharacterized protein n=1 Tax=Channa striata TaxID=64152 RepID=A0AA88LMW1_CHASR|nr:hypothetical protein Q5P01_000905 [Channa striata]